MCFRRHNVSSSCLLRARRACAAHLRLSLLGVQSWHHSLPLDRQVNMAYFHSSRRVLTQ
jgi:hypothetical protein